MKLLLDILACQAGSRSRGIGRYSLNLTRALVKNFPTDDLFLLGRQTPVSSIPEILAQLGGTFDAHRFKTLHLQRHQGQFNLPEHALASRMQQISLGHAYSQFNRDVVHVHSLFEWSISHPAPSDWFSPVTSTTLYDLIPLHYSEQYLAEADVFRCYNYRLEQIKNCDLLLAISEYTRIDAINRLGIEPDRIVNISGACDPHFSPGDLTREEQLSLCRFHITRPFLFYTGNLDFRKNIEGLLESYARLPGELRAHHQLVIVTGMSQEVRSRFQQTAAAKGLANDEIVFPGNVSDDDLRLLYRACTAFVFPSLCEGFGLPILEAMSCGAPTIAANNSSIPEILSRPDALFATADPDTITKALHRALTDSGYRSELKSYGIQRAAEFSWDRVAQKAHSAWENAFQRKLRQPKLWATNVGHPPANLVVVDLTPTEEKPNESMVAFCKTISKAYTIQVIPAAEIAGSANAAEIFSAYEHVIYFANQLAQLQSSIVEKWLSQEPGVVCLTSAPSLAATDASPDPVIHEKQCSILELALGFVVLDQQAADLWEKKFPKDLNHPLWRCAALVQPDLQTFLSSAFLRAQYRSPRKLLQSLHPPRFAVSCINRWLSFLVETSPRLREPRFYFDITKFKIDLESGYKTGVQRVVAKTLENLEKKSQPIHLVELSRNGRHFRFVRKLKDGSLVSTSFEATLQQNDVLLFPEIRDQLTADQPYWDNLHRAGVKLHVILYDLIALRFPQFFEPANKDGYIAYLTGIAQHADGIHCISQTVADEFIEWINGRGQPIKRNTPLHIAHFPLGADFSASTQDLAEPQGIDLPATIPTFISVGTLEPRKGYAQTLEAFEMLWKRSVDVRLCVIGRIGWMMDELITRIRQHPEFGRRLFFLQAISDAELHYCYKNATALINASACEGYGLPLVEAAHYGIPIIASDIPVFREVCGKNVTYFNRNSPEALAQIIEAFLRTPGNRPASEGIRSYSWEESTGQLLAAINGNWYQTIQPK